MSTLKEIALRTGVSVATVSRALNGKHKQNWPSVTKRAQEIRRIAQELDFRPNSAARAMKSNRTHHVGVLVRNSRRGGSGFARTDLAAYEIILGINDELELSDYVLSIIRYDDVAGHDDMVSRVFREKMLDGMIVLGGVPASISQRVKSLTANCIWVNNDIWQPQRCVRRDDVHAGRLAARALIELGYRRLVWMPMSCLGFPSHYSIDYRWQGLREATEERGIVPKVLEISTHAVPKNWPMFEQLLQPDVGLIAYNTAVALRVAQLAAAAGRRPGPDFGLVSCDDTHFVAHSWPELCRVAFDRYSLGQKAARMMLQLLHHPDMPLPSESLQDSWMPGSTAWGPQSRTEGSMPCDEA